MTYNFNVAVRQMQTTACHVCGGNLYQMVTIAYCDAEGDVVENVKSQQCQGCGKVTVRGEHEKIASALALNVPKASEHLPTGLAYSYEQARSIVSISGLASLLLLRAVIEGLCKYANIKEDSLYAMIEQLARKAKLPFARKTVLHRLRELGNDIAHKVSEIQEVNEEDLLDAFRSINIVAEALSKELNSVFNTSEVDIVASSSLYVPVIEQESGNVAASTGSPEDVKRENFWTTVRGCTNSIRSNPNKALLWSNRGLAYYQLRMYKEALADLHKAIELDKTDSVSYLRLGDTHNALGEFEAALISYEHALNLYLPATNAVAIGRACVKIGDLYMDGQKYDEAGDWFKKCVEANSEGYIGYYKYACASAGKGEAGEAISWLRLAGEHGGINLRFDYDLVSLQDKDDDFKAAFNELVADGIVVRDGAEESRTLEAEVG